MIKVIKQEKTPTYVATLYTGARNSYMTVYDYGSSPIEAKQNLLVRLYDFIKEVKKEQINLEQELVNEGLFKN